MELSQRRAPGIKSWRYGGRFHLLFSSLPSIWLATLGHWQGPQSAPPSSSFIKYSLFKMKRTSLSLCEQQTLNMPWGPHISGCSLVHYNQSAKCSPPVQNSERVSVHQCSLSLFSTPLHCLIIGEPQMQKLRSPLLRTKSCQSFSFEPWSGSDHSFTCLSCCQ